MTEEEIFGEVRAQLTSLLEDLAKEVVEILENTEPIENLGLDSMDGVEFACMLSEKFDIPDDINPFIDEKTLKHRTVGEIVELIALFESEAPTGE
jgi:acyl carrier protein